MWFITKLLDTNANHNSVLALLGLLPNVIHHEITWYECKSQHFTGWKVAIMECDSSRNYLIRMQITTSNKRRYWKRKMWFITKLLDTNANHNANMVTPGNTPNVIHHEITWYECKSQLSGCKLHTSAECDSSRNYLIRMQITTVFLTVTANAVMWFITKLLDTNANHNPKEA